MCMEETLRPASLFGGKTVFLFQDPLHGEALDPRAGSDCLLSHLPTSPVHGSQGSQCLGRGPWLGMLFPQAPGPASIQSHALEPVGRGTGPLFPWLASQILHSGLP